MSSPDPNYPQFPKLSIDEIKAELVPEVSHWALTNGLVMYPPTFNVSQSSVAPITLYPTPFPRKSFEQAVSVQTLYNKLYAKISQDKDGWLSSRIEELAKFDAEFTGKLWELHLEAKKRGLSQKLALGLFRSDYLLDADSLMAKQVEFNTVSVSFGGLSTKVGQVHRFLNDTGKYSQNSGAPFYSEELPVSDSSSLLSRGLADAVKKFETSETHTVVAFIIQKGERNVFDQRVLEYKLFQDYGIKSVRLTIHDINTKTTMDPNTKRLFYNPTGEEISVVYFRAGYSPQDFTNSQDWENRLLLETSYAIKAPNLLTQLAGVKKVQQILTEESTLKRFVPDEKERASLVDSFVKIYPMDDSEVGEKAKKMAMKSPERFVLKPQREGGGNNIYKTDIPLFLKTIPEHEWSGFILMELIKPLPTTENVVIRGEKILQEPILSELGIFGCVLFDENEIYSNDYAGWLLRSKSSTSDEGGVAAGFGCVDSVVLY
ncbi:LAME_0B02190g1_1 [Lachancea meyersii CBS 8951]|uniref:Glutathione synthetase n=1 Tax=Lachancea meyersii CBS 8951 TaxID=1266667 RepID=A0A1G4IU68_9SACH|nr:LAME_0B02190g1_1 [Lachancea meyersii CBS 8951]